MARFSRRFAPRVAALATMSGLGYLGWNRAQLELSSPSTPAASSPMPKLETSNARSRHDHLNELRTKKFDIVVVGGGITGLMAAIYARQHGLEVAVVDACDFGSGNTFVKSPLLPGGWDWCQRAIRQRDVSFLSNAWTEMQEVWKWRRALPECIVPSPTLVLSAHSTEQLEQVIVSAMWAAVSSTLRLTGFRPVTSGTVRGWFPNATDEVEGVPGGVILPLETLDSRRVVASLLSTLQAHGVTLMNHCAVVGLGVRASPSVADQGVIGTVNCEVTHVNSTKEQQAVQVAVSVADGGAVINATGPWCDVVRGLATTATPRFASFLLNTTIATNVGDLFHKSQVPRRFRAVIASSPFIDQPSLSVVPLGARRDDDIVAVGACAVELPAPRPPSAIEGKGARCADELSHIAKAAHRLGLNVDPASRTLVAQQQIVPLLNPKDAVARSVLRSGFAVQADANGLVNVYGGGFSMARRVAAEAVAAAERHRSQHLPTAAKDPQVETTMPTLVQHPRDDPPSVSPLLAASLEDIVARRGDISEHTKLISLSRQDANAAQSELTTIANGAGLGWDGARVRREVTRALATLKSFAVVAP